MAATRLEARGEAREPDGNAVTLELHDEGAAVLIRTAARQAKAQREHRVPHAGP